MWASLSTTLAVLLLTSSPAIAHGPSVRLSYGKVAPQKLVIHAGDVVHFQNVSTTPRTFTLQAEGAAFESPALARGEGWHREFSEAGSYRYGVAEFPDMRGEVWVAPRED